MARVSLKGDKEIQSCSGMGIYPEEEEYKFWSLMNSFHHKYYKIIVVTMICCQIIPKLCFPDMHLVLITSEKAKFNCRGDTSQFCSAESLIHEAMLTSAWNSSNINNGCTAC